MNIDCARASRVASGRTTSGRTWHTRALGLLLVAPAVLAACGDSSDAGSSGAGGGGEGRPDATATSAAAGTGTGGEVPPPEEELESSFTAPVATGNLVWIANPVSGRVAFIDARTLEVKVTFAGNEPSFLAAVPDPADDVALVLNVASRDATLLRASAETRVLTTRSFPVPDGGNAWSVGPDGRFAIAWSDARAVDDADPLDGYQDISVLDLRSEGGSTPLTVGYRPVAVAFAEDGERAFAVTQDGITVIDLEGDAPVVVENIALTDDPLESTLTRDVAITPDGAWALVRRDGDAVITVHSLDDGERTDVVLPGPATDLDLSADGSVAVVVIRELGTVALLPIPEVAEDPEDFATFEVEDTVVGSAALAAQSSTGFLYTNAVTSPVITVFDADDESPEPRSILLRAPVDAVFPTQGAEHALVLHDAFEVEGSRYPGAVSVVPIGANLPPKIVGLDAPAIAIAIAPSGEQALVATGDAEARTYGFVVAHMPSLQVDAFTLGSLPIAAGIVAGAGRGYVSQEHPDGRITFIDFATDEVRTLTGFELAAQVVDGGVR
jgi:DNA-binding beta-propeller fold protein YncE